MPVIEHDEAIRGYWNEVKDRYPGLSFAEFDKVCRSPFLFIRASIKRSSLPIILVKYLGKIRPFSVTVARMIRSYRGKPEHEEKVQFLTQYLNALKDYETKEKDTEDQDQQQGETYAA